jgi:hypothetical protein
MSSPSTDYFHFSLTLTLALVFVLEIGIWNLVLVWDLEFVIWNLGLRIAFPDRLPYTVYRLPSTDCFHFLLTLTLKSAL